MNYYPHHIGDYLRDTAHLSILEDGTYRRMLDLYYASEKPLPVNIDGLYRLVRAKTREERSAVDTILEEFFERQDDGWHNKRADEEIIRAREDGAENKAKRENELERQRRHRERRRKIFDELRKHGVVPKWDTPFNELETLLQRTCHGTCHGDTTAPTTAIHKPIPNINTTDGKPSTPEGFDEFWAIYPRRAGGNPKVKAAKSYRARLADGHPANDLIEGARRYAAFVRATGKEGTEYVKQAATFLGPDKHFLEKWELPEQTNVSPLYRREGVM